MIPIEYEINRLKEIILEMFDLVKSQIEESRSSVVEMNYDLAESVIRREMRVNALEITIDRECENLLACYNPVASDLRFVISILKISESLERISDHAYRIAKYLQGGDLKKDSRLYKELQIEGLFNTIISMIDNVVESIEKQDTSIAKKVFKLDKTINKTKKDAPAIIKKYVKENIDGLENALYLFSVIGKLERCGDVLKNIGEEIVFYLEAQILRHQKRNSKIRKRIEKEEDKPQNL
ncbi:MAG: phosphate signaling complex protein PhoU [Bacteroidales bacterium]|nr:phosphate signaling complex protein PhoU [Bacteroidales bacterium]